MKLANSYVIYNGPSLIDGAPIVCIVTGIQSDSGNTKTGSMLQTWIIRSDMHPLDASKSGEDASVCGNCVHRGKPTDDPAAKQAKDRTCYVALFQAPANIFKAFAAGKYQHADDATVRLIGRDRMVRLGSYGDPAAVPREVWDALLAGSIGHTGYTHNLHVQPSMSDICMVSADSKMDAMEARTRGYRSFRVIPVHTYTQHGKAALMRSEVLCPASTEGKREGVTCETCKLCSGASKRGKSIAIVAHGSARNKVA